MMELTTTTRCYQPTDNYTLVNHRGHCLWQTQLFEHCSSPAAWRQYQEALGHYLPEDGYRDFTGTVQLWYGLEQWQGFLDSVDRVYCHLRNNDIPINDSAIGNLVLQVRDEHSETPFLRGKSALCVYLRLDFEAEKPCQLEFDTGETAHLAGGTLIIASGYRRHRLSGQGHILHFQLTLPALARPEALITPELRQPDISDEVAFAAATALPLNKALPSPTAILDKLTWLQRRAYRSHRNGQSPSVKRFLLNNADPASATAEELEQIRSYGTNNSAHGNSPVVVVDNLPVLTADQCTVLRRHICEHITSVVPDSVDDQPEYQVNITLEQLAELLDQCTVDKLLALPDILHQHADLNGEEGNRQTTIFLRIYSPDTRPYITFHSDICRYTAVLALNDESEFQGGRFVMLGDNQLQTVPWHSGNALLHAGNLVHGVSRLTEGVRYSLVLFYSVAP
ncbi:2OG-Fe(II) oxygenase [Microbulbifer sp. SSSA002]|uniref:2OG-Fe(II) oxygenase n=1 Tax=Microbulbifer sp. SSSA002 TaxID=3243376 RepID=UPI004039A56E